MKLIFTITSYNGTGGHTVSSGQFSIGSQNDLNRSITLLERTASRADGRLDLDLLGPFNRDCKLPAQYARIRNESN